MIPSNDESFVSYYEELLLNQSNPSSHYDRERHHDDDNLSTNPQQKIALLRRRALDGGGLAIQFVKLVDGAVRQFVALCNSSVSNDNRTTATTSTTTTNNITMSPNNDTVIHSIDFVRRILVLILHLCHHDPILSEEMAYDGLHGTILKLLNFDMTTSCDHDNHDDDMETDLIIELQDLAGEIASLSSSNHSTAQFPCPASPYTMDELRSRLPLVFTFCRTATNNTLSCKNVESQPNNFHNAKQRLLSSSSSVVDTKNTNNNNTTNEINDGTDCSTNKSNVVTTTTILIHQVTIRQSAQEDVGFGTCRPCFVECIGAFRNVRRRRNEMIFFWIILVGL